MNTLRVVEWLAEAGLVARCTALLALAWLAHVALARANPRWRVALWRATAVGLAGVAVLAALPPLVVWEVPAQKEEEERPAVSMPRAVAAPAMLEAPPAVVVAEAIEPAAVERGPEGGGIPARVEEAWEWPVPPGGWWRAAWLAGVLLLGARLAVGAGRLSRLVSRAEEAPAWVLEERDAIGARLGLRREVRVRVSAEVRTPCLVGAFRPLLLLPAGGERGDLRAVLAHELAHARGDDLIWNHLLHGSGVLLWFHPLAWRVRGAHAAACDGVCDAVAADLLGDVHAYGRTLARLALKVAGSSPAPGLAMARTAEVRRRIEFLQRRVFRSPLSRRMLMPAMLLSGLLVAVVGGVGIGVAQEGQRKDASTPAPAPAGQADRMTIRVTDAATGGPLEGAEVVYRIGVGAGASRGEPLTDEEGMVTLNLPAGAERSIFLLWVRKVGYVPSHVALDGLAHPLDLPRQKLFAMRPGQALGGLVRDEKGRPIEGATVAIMMPPTESDRPNRIFEIARPKTDAEGRWRIDEAPADLGRVGIMIEHPGFRSSSAPAAPGLDNPAVLTRGPSVRGRVLDAEGRPVVGAKAAFGSSIGGGDVSEGITGEDGTFTLENCEVGSSIVTIQANGFAPELQEVRVGPDGSSGPLEFRLGPAGVIRGRVVDRDGRPIAGAFFAADTWRGHRWIMHRGETDADGRFSWENAPRDVVEFDFGKSGYMFNRDVKLVASEQDNEVVLFPILTISGRLTDVRTGESIPSFQVVEGRRYAGREEIRWLANEAVDYSGGDYSRSFDEPSEAVFLRFTAPGYAQTISRPFRCDEGQQRLDLALAPAEGLTGVVLLPDGRPAVGTSVGLATAENRLVLKEAQFDPNSRGMIVRTDSEGRFGFPPSEGEYMLVALSDAGYARATQEEFAAGGKLELRPWGRIEGRVFVGREPGASEWVGYQPRRRISGGGLLVMDNGYDTQADAEGLFSFDRVVPGPGNLSRQLVAKHPGGLTSFSPGWYSTLDVPPRATVEATIGGKGRAVVGRVVASAKPEQPIDWSRSGPLRLFNPEPDQSALPGAPGGQAMFFAGLDGEGRFRIDDVPPGSYSLQLTVDPPATALSRGSGNPIGVAVVEVVVPEGPEGEPVDLGEVVAEIWPALKVGEVAPEFTAITTGGGSFKLSDRRGKFVLLDFWATWCGPCLAAMPEMKELHAAFGGDGRFEMVGLACDEGIGAPALKSRELGLGWTQAFIGPLAEGVGAAYHVRSIPATFLIGPDGRILAKNLRGAELREAVRRALEE